MVRKIDNIKVVSDILKFDQDTYYLVQIVKRRKDPGNENLGRGEVKLLEIYLRKEGDLLTKESMIRAICESENARAYISLIPRSKSKLLGVMFDWLSKNIGNPNLDPTRIVSKNSLDKRTTRAKGLMGKVWWMIDIDNPGFLETVKSLLTEINMKVNYVLETPNGYHMIIDSFNPKDIEPWKKEGVESTYEYQGSEFMLRKECNTILYY